MENSFNPHRIFKLVKEYISSEIDGNLSPAQMEILIHLSIHIQMCPSHLIGITRHLFNEYQSASDCLFNLIEDDYIDYVIETKKLISKIILPSDLRDEISKQHYPLPMTSLPKPVKKNKGGAYHSIKLHLLLGSKLNRHTYPLAYDTINKLNATPLRIRKDYINPDLINPSDKKHHKQLAELSELLPSNSPVYLTHAYDKRGRIYCRGYHFNYQGDSYHKSLIEIAVPEKVK